MNSSPIASNTSFSAADGNLAFSVKYLTGDYKAKEAFLDIHILLQRGNSLLPESGEIYIPLPNFSAEYAFASAVWSTHVF